MENDVLLKEGWLEMCKDLWESEHRMEEDENGNWVQHNVVGFITCHNSPEHPCPEETRKCLDGMHNGHKIIYKPTERSTHLFASVERWEKFGKIPIERPKEAGGSQIDWWLMGHPTKYEQSEHSLRKENEWVAVIPGYCYHVGNISSTYGKLPLPETDEFVNLIVPYVDGRGDICFQFNPMENKEFWDLPNKRIGALYMSCNEDMYIMQSLLSIQRLVDYIVIADNSSTDRTLEMIEKFKKLKDSPPVFVVNMPKDDCEIIGYNSLLGSHIGGGIDVMKEYFSGGKCDWMIQMEPDLVLYEVPDDTLRKTASYLELRGFNALNVFMRDFVYDYAHLNAVDWGEGASNFYSERRFFRVTSKTGYAAHNYLCPRNEGSKVPTYYRFWPEWNGLVAKSRYIKFAHYGFCRGVERIRMRSYFKCSSPFIFWDENGFKRPSWRPYDDVNHEKETTYQIPTIIFKGKHPKYMCIDD
jgi:glycosyltransferase involved in cell wall biosynthesis